MTKYLKQIPDFLLFVVIITAFYLLIRYEKVQVFVLERYYKFAKIPYYKQSGKFNPYLIRLDRK